MTLLRHLNPTMPRERSWAPTRSHGRSLSAGVLVAAGLCVAACGSSGATTILNTEKIERAIESSSLAQRGKHVQVTCPSGVRQSKGLVFSCTALVERGSARFVVTELDGSGHVHYAAP
jgi:hypothetical protein